MIIASIDIGTNTILLLIAEVNSTGIVRILHDEQVFARLGKGVDADRRINHETFDRVAQYLLQYHRLCNQYRVDTIRAVGTSALRDATNRTEFVSAMKEKTDINIEILSGDDEAQWTYRGGISEFVGQSDHFSVIDIGGGSTEIIVGNSRNIIEKTSVDIGSVRMTERILKGSPPDNAAVIEAHKYVSSQLRSINFGSIQSSFAVGVAGTLTTLAALHQKLPSFIPEKISGYSLTYNDICALFGVLKDKSISQIMAIPQIASGRHDIILAGIMILMGYMERCGLQQITVSIRGLRYGIVFREIDTFA